MTRKVLLTGRPGCGKTTLIKRLVNKLARSLGGFYTEEMREAGTRVGFKLVTLDREEAVFAHVDFGTRERVGKYGLNLSAVEAVGVKAIRASVRAQHLVVIDEIGPKEIRSPIFRHAVNEALDSGVPILATISARSLPFADAIKKRRDVTVIEVRPDSREHLVCELSDQFKKLNRARRVFQRIYHGGFK
jgi:nucleoside-triphosphatase